MVMCNTCVCVCVCTDAYLCMGGVSETKWLDYLFNIWPFTTINSQVA